MEFVKVGSVSSVNKEERTARVQFPDGDFVSAPLIVLKYSPLIKVLDTNLTYVTKQNEVEKQESHAHNLEIVHWMPSVGDVVLCIFLPYGGGDGYVIGGI